jgi:hypothetical protein
MEGVDQISFFEGDRIGECNLVRRADGGRHCVVSFFTIRRGTGRIDAFVSGIDGVKEKAGVSEDFVHKFMDDMRAAAAENKALYPTEWERVDLSGCKTIVEDVAALKRAGLPMWTRVEEG